MGFVYTGTKAVICKCTFLLVALCLFGGFVCVFVCLFALFCEQLQTNYFLNSVSLLASGLEIQLMII